MPDKDKLKQMAAGQLDPEKKKQYDEDAEYLYYEEKLREALKNKNPKQYENFLSQLSAKRRGEYESMRANMLTQAQNLNAGVKMRAAATSSFQQDKPMPIPAEYKDQVSDEEVKQLLGEEGYKRFQYLRQLPRLGGYVDAITQRSNFSGFGPQDLQIKKNIGNDSYTAKYTPPVAVMSRK